VFVVVAGRVPSYLGSSFSFVAVVIAASAYPGHGPNQNLDVALGGMVAAGVPSQMTWDWGSPSILRHGPPHRG